MTENLTDQEKAELKAKIEKEIKTSPPTIGVIGLSGVGKSTTINTLFKTSLPVSDTVACTRNFESMDFQLSFKSEDAKSLALNRATIRVVDAPGLGEDIENDKKHLKMYQKNLPNCDVILWILAARNRAVALDQMYIEKLKKFHKKMIFGINQVDLVEPINWNKRINLPSEEMESNIGIIIEDRKQKIQNSIKENIRIMGFSAKCGYRLEQLFNMLIGACSKDRQWLMASLKGFSYTDFYPKELLDKVKN